MEFSKKITPIEEQVSIFGIPAKIANLLPDRKKSIPVNVRFNGRKYTLNYNSRIRRITGVRQWFKDGLRPGHVVRLKVSGHGRSIKIIVQSTDKKAPKSATQSSAMSSGHDSSQQSNDVIAFHTVAVPPVKWAPNKNNAEVKERLRQAAQEAMGGRPPIPGDIWIQIRYNRGASRYDSANLINGIADTLNKICYKDDLYLKSIDYVEHKGTKDEYWIVVSPARW